MRDTEKKLFNLKGKEVGISKRCLYAYEQYTMKETTAEDLIAILWAWCHKKDIDDVIAKMKVGEIADVIEESMREEFIGVSGDRDSWEKLCSSYSED